MRVAVIGAGAMGSLYGGMFHDAGHAVTMVDRNPAVVAAIRERGMRITRADGRTDTYRVEAVELVDPAPAKAFDLVLFQVKGFATEAAARALRPAVSPQTLVLSLQNGLGNEDVLRSVFPDNPLLLGISVHSAAMIGPGETNHSGVRNTVIGPSRQPDIDAARTAADALRPAGFEVAVESEGEIRREIFSKWVLNCGSLPLAALTTLPTAQMGQSENALAVAGALTREACMLAALSGYPLDADERVEYNADLFRTAGGKASMLQDIEAGRRTEIETINGAAVRIAEGFGVACPHNWLAYNLVCGREVAMGLRSPKPSHENRR